VRYAINNWVYNDEPLRDTFARLAKYGYEGVELKGEFTNFTADEVKALSREFGLKVPSVLGWNIYPFPGRDLATTSCWTRGSTTGRRAVTSAVRTSTSAPPRRPIP